MNGSRKWVILGTIVGVLGLALSYGSGYIVAVRSDAAFRQRTETFMLDSADLGPRLSEVTLASALNREHISDLTRRVDELVQSQQRLTDKIDLLIQAEMRNGRVAR